MTGDADRRAYWIEQMELAAAFNDAVLEHPVAESLEPVVPIADAARDAGVELAFAERPHPGGRARIYLLRASLVDDLLASAESFSKRGWRLVIEDGYRTREMQRALATAPEVIGKVAA